MPSCKAEAFADSGKLSGERARKTQELLFLILILILYVWFSVRLALQVWNSCFLSFLYLCFPSSFPNCFFDLGLSRSLTVLSLMIQVLAVLAFRGEIGNWNFKISFSLLSPLAVVMLQWRIDDSFRIRLMMPSRIRKWHVELGNFPFAFFSSRAFCSQHRFESLDTRAFLWCISSRRYHGCDEEQEQGGHLQVVQEGVWDNSQPTGGEPGGWWPFETSMCEWQRLPPVLCLYQEPWRLQGVHNFWACGILGWRFQPGWLQRCPGRVLQRRSWWKEAHSQSRCGRVTPF